MILSQKKIWVPKKKLLIIKIIQHRKNKIKSLVRSILKEAIMIF
jgi:hypothetical protein